MVLEGSITNLIHVVEDIEKIISSKKLHSAVGFDQVPLDYFAKLPLLFSVLLFHIQYLCPQKDFPIL